MEILSALSLLFSLLSLKAIEWYMSAVSYWPLEDISNRIVKDYIGGNDGRIAGEFETVSGIVGSALALSGNDSWVDFGVLPSVCLNSPSTCPSGFTIAFWLKIPEFQGNRIILQLGQHRFSRGFTFWTRRNLKRKVGFSVNTHLRKYDWTQDWAGGGWTHIAVQWHATNAILKIYFNCTVVKVIEKSGNAEPDESNKVSALILGASHAFKKNIKLMIDEFAIWDRTVEDATLCKVFNTRSVHGNYSNWSKFGACSLSCGNGTKQRTRNCTNPAPANRGRNCSSLGPSEEHRVCFVQECPIDGNFSEWSVFSACSKTCGNGTSQRSRNCSNPKPKYGGRNCSHLGLDVEITECNTHRCPINGGLTSWSQFSDCDKSCGVGTRHRSRTCSNPSPMYGGLNCSQMGPTIERQLCNTHACPVHGGYGEWTDFSVCTKSCGNGAKHRTRNCSNPVPAHGGLDCARLGFPVETQECNTHHCPINGDYTSWTEFSTCSKSCGKGIQSRTRNCSNPTPRHGGKNCSHLGSSLERRRCVLRPCPIHGGFTVWSSFGKCSRPCGMGIRNRTRECTNPQPKHGGNDCNGTAIEIIVCNTLPCPDPVHGNYTPWSNFSLCSTSCGNGSMLRTRQCTNPPPRHGGIDCSILGPAREVKNCNVFSCPIHGNYSSWSNFSICSKTCGNGITVRMRNCSNPAPAHGGSNCSFLGPPEETRSCNEFPCPVHGSYSSWSNFSSCSRTCGNGTMSRTRNCSDPAPKHGGRNCSLLGSAMEVRGCNIFPCPIHGDYASWSNFSVCSKSCGNGVMERTRNCSSPTPKHGGRDCSTLGSARETRSCFVIPCPVHGNYSEWSNFSACSKICGNGTKTRARTCTNPLPLHNGNNCTLLGPSTESLPCNVFPCPVDGEYTEWGNFSQCSTSCGGGITRRTRNCSNPAPLHGGRTCSRLGPAMEEVPCNKQSCPIDGGYTPWSKFGNCRKTCGTGVSYRKRNCSNPVPQFGGRNCSRLGPAFGVRHCNLRPCPIDGGYSAWSNFTQCTHSCNGGKMTRTRLCNQPMPRHGGLNCSHLGPNVEVQSCNTVPCPIHGGYNEWTEFMPCTTTCGGGMRIRRRNCTNPQPMHGGRDCTHLGPSIERFLCNEQNCPDIVFRVTVNLTSETWDDGLEYNTSLESMLLSRQIKHRVRQTLGKETVSAVEDFSFRKGSVIADFSISLFHHNYQGITLLQDALLIDGQLEKTLPITAIRLSSTDVPDMAPANLTAANSSSRSIRLEWSTIPLNHSNGDIHNYRLTYYEATQQEERQKNPVKRQMILDGNQLSAHVTALKKFTEYSFRIAGINRRGVGVDSLPVSASTDQDRPSVSPTKVNATSTSSTTIRVTWSPIPTPFVHGILRGYNIHFFNLDPEGYGHVDSGVYSTEAVNTSVVLTKRLKYTTYKIQVSGFTVKGEGPLSDPIHVTTDQDVPSKPPANVVGKNLTSKSIEIRWNALHPRDVNGILLGYRISYIATNRRDGGKWNETEVSRSTTSAVIVKLRKFTKYMVCVEGFTVMGSGIHSKSVAVRTDEDKPDAYPQNITGFDKSSTELFIEWQEIPEQHRNGILLGYKVFYAPSKPHQPFAEKIVSGTMTSTTLQKLKKYTVYSIKVAGFTSKGLGPFSPVIERRTSEDVPSKAAIAVKAWNTSHTSIRVTWIDIPRDFIHGVLLGYRVLFWRRSESRDTYDMKVIGPDKNTVELKDLWIYTKYFIEVLGFTSIGDGTVSKKIVVSTDEFTPSLPPVNVRALNKTSPTKIVVRWNPIPDKFYIHGVLRGYRVLYKVIAIANDSLGTDVGTNSVTVEPTVLVAELLNLTAFTRYEIKVLAFTVKGDGVKSKPIRAETCNCHSTLYTNWWINPPYVDSTDSNKTGIITPILKEVIHTCCENCTAHGTSQIDFDRTAVGRPAQKSGLVQFKRGFEENTELHYPVYGFMDQTRYSNNYGFVPFVQSPGLALIIIGDEEGTAAKLLLNSLALCWPILFLSIVMLWVSSIALWFVETAANERHFPHNVLHGSWEAMWWAFASMTTLGYGDRIPRTAVGRMLCLLWILLGLVMVTCFNSTMTTLLTARILNKEVTLYGTKIAAIQNSSEYRLAIRKNARVNTNGKEYTNLQEVYEALTNRDVKGILIDAYTVGSKKALFDRRDLRISKLLDYSSAYGVVLGGEGRKLQKCFQRYVSEQRSDISKIVEDNVERIEVTSQSMTVERSKGLFDPQFPTYIRAMIVCAVVLSVIWMVGAKFELAKKLGWIKFRKKGKRDGSFIPRSLKFKRNKEELKVEMSRIVAIFKMNCEYRKRVLQQKHKKELLYFIKLQKQSDNKLVKKSSFHSDSFLSFSLGAKAFTRSENNKAQKNGHAKWDSSLKQENEVETLV